MTHRCHLVPASAVTCLFTCTASNATSVSNTVITFLGNTNSSTTVWKKKSDLTEMIGHCVETFYLYEAKDKKISR